MDPQVHLESKVLSDSLDLLEMMVNPVLEDNKAYTEKRVMKVHGASLDLLVHVVCRDFLVLQDLRETAEMVDHLDHRDQ